MVLVHLRDVVVAVVTVGVLATSACSKDAQTVSEQANAGDRKGYMSGNGAVDELASKSRAGPVQLSGTTVTGGTWDSRTEGNDKIVVVNVWGQWCPPCVEEAPQLQQVWMSLLAKGSPVAFVGVDLRDCPATALAFINATGITYPSISDQASGGQPILALQGKASATPTTLILDRRGRIAARILGPTSAATVSGLVDDVVKE